VSLDRSLNIFIVTKYIFRVMLSLFSLFYYCMRVFTSLEFFLGVLKKVDERYYVLYYSLVVLTIGTCIPHLTTNLIQKTAVKLLMVVPAII
jgi:ABC-type multidrug transport system permease subunit